MVPSLRAVATTASRCPTASVSMRRSRLPSPRHERASRFLGRGAVIFDPRKCIKKPCEGPRLFNGLAWFFEPLL
jgi:hypothetical protein